MNQVLRSACRTAVWLLATAAATIGIALLTSSSASASESHDATQEQPVLDLVDDLAGPLTQPVTDGLRPAVDPVTRPVEKALAPVTKPVTEAVSRTVAPVTRPVAESVATPLAPVTDRVVEPVADAAGEVVAPVTAALAPSSERPTIPAADDATDLPDRTPAATDLPVASLDRTPTPASTTEVGTVPTVELSALPATGASAVADDLGQVAAPDPTVPTGDATPAAAPPAVGSGTNGSSGAGAGAQQPLADLTDPWRQADLQALSTSTSRDTRQGSQHHTRPDVSPG